ncbi:DMT family transporter [Marinomonas sp. 2405UD68-3]|uniref:DMT family transporter n=1 Tax=Marinomonas sp. 2405UD68-3 TaxID=3391835 RepID=UPI0039C8E748
MSGKTVSSAIVLLILGNLMATLCDAFIKMAGKDIPVFQFTFMRVVCMILCLLPFIRQVNWAQPFEGAKLHFLRGGIWVVAGVLLVFALGDLPLATANAVFYTAPLLIIFLASLFYKETLSCSVMFAALFGLIGILIILRPSELSLGIINALLFALALAFNSLLIRQLPKKQTLVHGMLLTYFFAMLMVGGLAFFENAQWDWSLVIFAFASSVCSIFYSFTCLLAYRYVASSEVASAEYSGLISAMVVGWLWFNESMDVFVVIGSLFIIMPLVYISHRDNRRRRDLIGKASI